MDLRDQLQHPHIVPLLSAGDSDGLPYFTMPLVDGETLRVRLARDSIATETDRSVRAFVLARTGQRAAAEAILRRFEQQPVGRQPNGVAIGYVYAALGEWERALDEFIKGAERRQWGGIFYGRELKPIRALPRYQELMRKMNLQDQPIAKAAP